LSTNAREQESLVKMRNVGEGEHGKDSVERV
jgi:hypothetical protein